MEMRPFSFTVGGRTEKLWGGQESGTGISMHPLAKQMMCGRRRTSSIRRLSACRPRARRIVVGREVMMLHVASRIIYEVACEIEQPCDWECERGGGDSSYPDSEWPNWDIPSFPAML